MGTGRRGSLLGVRLCNGGQSIATPKICCEWIRCLLSWASCSPCGPAGADAFDKTVLKDFHSKIDWENADHQRIVASALVNSVYLLQSERTSFRKRRIAKGWWKGLGFQRISTLYEGSKCSGIILGAIFKYDGNGDQTGNSHNNAPAFVIAFRGTANIWDVIVDATLLVRTVNVTDRLLNAKNEVKKFMRKHKYRSVPKGSSPKLWLAGHSLGAAVAISVGMSLIQDKVAETDEFSTFLFNPPFVALTYGIESGKTEQSTKLLYELLKKFESLVASLLKPILGAEKDAGEHLRRWVPNLFVHPEDLICMGFITYFEKKENEKGKKVGILARLSSNSGETVAIGWEWSNCMTLNYLLRSATLYVNRGEKKQQEDDGAQESRTVQEIESKMGGEKESQDWWLRRLGRAHSLDQWWDPKLHLEPRKHIHSEIMENTEIYAAAAPGEGSKTTGTVEVDAAAVTVSEPETIEPVKTDAAMVVASGSETTGTVQIGAIMVSAGQSEPKKTVETDDAAISTDSLEALETLETDAAMVVVASRSATTRTVKTGAATVSPGGSIATETDNIMVSAGKSKTTETVETDDVAISTNRSEALKTLGSETTGTVQIGAATVSARGSKATENDAIMVSAGISETTETIGAEDVVISTDRTEALKILVTDATLVSTSNSTAKGIVKTDAAAISASGSETKNTAEAKAAVVSTVKSIATRTAETEVVDSAEGCDLEKLRKLTVQHSLLA